MQERRSRGRLVAVRLFMLAVTAIAVLAIAQSGTGANNPTRYYCSGPQSEISNWNTDPVQTGNAQTAVLTVPSAECVLGAATYLSTAGNSATAGTITLANNPNLINPITIPTTAQPAATGFVNMVGSRSASPPPAQHSAPPPAQRSAPSPALHPSGGGAAASERGHSSMRR